MGPQKCSFLHPEDVQASTTDSSINNDLQIPDYDDDSEQYDGEGEQPPPSCAAAEPEQHDGSNLSYDEVQTSPSMTQWEAEIVYYLSTILVFYFCLVAFGWTLFQNISMAFRFFFLLFMRCACQLLLLRSSFFFAIFSNTNSGFFTHGKTLWKSILSRENQYLLVQNQGWLFLYETRKIKFVQKKFWHTSYIKQRGQKDA